MPMYTVSNLNYIHLQVFRWDMNYNLPQLYLSWCISELDISKYLIFYDHHLLLAPHSSPRHIIVQTRGRIFSCTVLDENMEPLTPPEIEW